MIVRVNELYAILSNEDGGLYFHSILRKELMHMAESDYVRNFEIGAVLVCVL